VTGQREAGQRAEKEGVSLSSSTCVIRVGHRHQKAFRRAMVVSVRSVLCSPDGYRCKPHNAMRDVAAIPKARNHLRVG